MALGKKINLSFTEVESMNLKSFFELAEAINGKSEKEEQKIVRKPASNDALARSIARYEGSEISARTN